MIYTYEAYGQDGAVERGELDALNEQEVVDHLRARALVPTSIKKQRAAGEGLSSGVSFSIFERISPVDIVFLVRNLGVMLKSGLSISEALDILIDDAEKVKMKAMLTRVRTNLRGGKPLSESFSQDLRYFPPIFLGMVKAGESSGKLDAVFDELGAYLYKEYNLTQKVKSALTYPVILLIGSTVVVWLMLTLVLPRIANVFNASGAHMPAVTSFFIALGSFLSNNLILSFAAAAAVVWFFTGFRKTETGQRFFFHVMMRLPAVGTLVKKIVLVRLAHSFGNLLQSGMSATEALELTGESIGNDVYERAFKEVGDDVKEGAALSKSFSKHPELFPNIFVSLVTVGERTGTLGSVLLNLADFYEEDVDDALKTLASLVEPVILLAIGLLIGTIALSVLLPIYQLMGQFA